MDLQVLIKTKNQAMDLCTEQWTKKKYNFHKLI